MGTKRIGLARFEALIENLKREIIMGAGTSMAGVRKKITTLSNASGAIALTGGSALTEADYPSGTLFALDLDSATNDAAITLPALTAGLEYTFLVQTTAGSNVGLIINGPGDNIKGVAVCDNGTEDVNHSDDACTTITFNDQLAVAGTKLSFICDGVHWNVVIHALCDINEIGYS